MDQTTTSASGVDDGTSPPPGQANLAQMTGRLQTAGYNGPWDSASVTAAYARTYNGGNAAGNSGGSGNGSGSGGSGVPGMEFYNPAVWQQVQAQIQAAYNEKLNKTQNEQLALQAAQDAATNAIAKLNLTQQQQQSLLTAATAASQQGLTALQLDASLTGPRNAFQQQQVLHGLNAGGYSNAIDAIAGKYSIPSFEAPHAAPQGISLQTLAEDAKAAGTGGLPQVQNPLDQVLAALMAQQGYNAPYTGAPPTTTTGTTPPIDPVSQTLSNIYAGLGWTPPAGSPAPSVGSGTPSTGTAGTYATGNGPKTVAQMLSELDTAAGGKWTGDHSDAGIAAQYAATTGKPVTPPATAAPVPTTPTPTPAPTPPPAPAPWVSTNAVNGGAHPSVTATPAPTAPTVGVPPPLAALPKDPTASQPTAAFTAPLASSSTQPKMDGQTATQPSLNQPTSSQPSLNDGFTPTTNPFPLKLAPSASPDPTGHGGTPTGLADQWKAVKPVAPGVMPLAGVGDSTGGMAPADQWLAAFPSPQSADAKQFFRLDPDTQDLILGGWEKQGWGSRANLLNTLHATLPSFTAPTYGTIAAG